jgi:hypothetical protein
MTVGNAVPLEVLAGWSGKKRLYRRETATANSASLIVPQLVGIKSCRKMAAPFDIKDNTGNGSARCFQCEPHSEYGNVRYSLVFRKTLVIKLWSAMVTSVGPHMVVLALDATVGRTMIS